MDTTNEKIHSNESHVTEQHKESRRSLLKYLVVALLFVFPVFTVFSRKKQQPLQTITFGVPDEHFGKFFPRDSVEDRKALKMSSANNDFVEIKEVRFVNYGDEDGEDYDVVITLEFLGEVLENRRFQLELRALDNEGKVLASQWNETHDIRVVTQKQNQSDYAKKYGFRFIPEFVMSLNTGISKDTFYKIASIELETIATLGKPPVLR